MTSDMRSVMLVLLLVSTLGAGPSADWPLFGHDAARSAVVADRALTPGNVARLHVRWRIMLGDVADNAPIVVGSRLYQTRRDGTTVAIDVATGRVAWRFATHGPKITTSVPAFDAATNALYVPGVDGAVHKLDPASGRELRTDGFPVSITRAPETEKDASPLNLAGGYLYAQTAGYVGDATPYVGHVVAIRTRDGRAQVFNVLCTARHTLVDPQSCPAQRAGMWSRAGVVVDPDPSMQGRIYVATGNAPFDAAAGNYGDSILALDAGANRLLGFLTPGNYAELESSDLDVGSSSPAMLPRERDSATPLLAVQGGKDSVLRLFDRTHFPGLGAPLQTLALGNELFSAPAVWTDAHAATMVFIRLADGVHAYRLTTANRRSRLVAAWNTNLPGDSGDTSPVIAGGVLFAATGGGLSALDARTGRQLWSGALGPVHWESPAVAGNAVFCSDESGALTAFAL